MLKRNILIFHLGALGDYVLTWPLMLAMGRMFAQSRVISVTHKSKGLLAEKALRIESDDIDSSWQALFAVDGEIDETRQRRVLGSQTIVSFVSSPDDTFSTNLRKIDPAVNLVCLKARPDESYLGHASEFVLDQLVGVKVIAEGMKQMLSSIAQRGLGLHRGGGGVVIHPGSGSEKKNWPIDHFVELAVRLRERGRKVRFIVGEVELQKWDSAALRSLESAADVSQLRDPIQLLGAIQSADHFVGNDSGPTHLAGIVGVPTTVLFGAASAANMWKPLGPSVRVIERDEIANIPVDEVASLD